MGLAFMGVLIAAYDFADIFAKPVFRWTADRRGLKANLFSFIGGSTRRIAEE